MRIHAEGSPFRLASALLPCFLEDFRPQISASCEELQPDQVTVIIEVQDYVFTHAGIEEGYGLQGLAPLTLTRQERDIRRIVVCMKGEIHSRWLPMGATPVKTDHTNLRSPHLRSVSAAGTTCGTPMSPPSASGTFRPSRRRASGDSPPVLDVPHVVFDATTRRCR